MEHIEIRGIKITERQFENPLYQLEKKTLWINSKRLKRSFRYLKKYNIKSIAIDYKYYEPDNLEILKKFELEQIQEIWIRKDFKNLNILAEFKNLKVLTITDECKKAELDFSFIRGIKILTAKWSSRYTNFEQLTNLISCKLDYFKNDDLKLLSNFKKIIKLELVNGTIKTLSGIENLSNLKEIHLYYLKYLKSFEGITKNHKNLELFFTYSIPNIEKISSLGNARNLKVLQISKTNKEYDSFKFLDNLKKLERVKIICEKVSDKNLKHLYRTREKAPWN